MPTDVAMHFKMKSLEGALFPSIKKKAQPCCGHVTAGTKRTSAVHPWYVRLSVQSGHSRRCL